MRNDTQVTFPAGSLLETAKIQEIVAHGGQLAIITDVTPFHPLDHKWPDQPADRGTISGVDGVLAELSDCITAARNGANGQMEFGSEISAGRGDDGWQYYCAHLVEKTHGFAVGDEVVLTVDPQYRLAVTAAHTGCHLAALALNKALTSLWKKDTRRDALGHPDFDQMALQASSIEPLKSLEVYRIGKSLKKRGFLAASFWEQASGLAEQINTQLADWLATGSDIQVVPARSGLTDMRIWHCTLDGTPAQIPCGGSHLSALKDLADIRVDLSFDQDSAIMEMKTAVTPAS